MNKQILADLSCRYMMEFIWTEFIGRTPFMFLYVNDVMTLIVNM